MAGGGPAGDREGGMMRRIDDSCDEDVRGTQASRRRPKEKSERSAQEKRSGGGRDRGLVHPSKSVQHLFEGKVGREPVGTRVIATQGQKGATIGDGRRRTTNRSRS